MDLEMRKRQVTVNGAGEPDSEICSCEPQASDRQHGRGALDKAGDQPARDPAEPQASAPGCWQRMAGWARELWALPQDCSEELGVVTSSWLAEYRRMREQAQGAVRSVQETACRLGLKAELNGPGCASHSLAPVDPEVGELIAAHLSAAGPGDPSALSQGAWSALTVQWPAPSTASSPPSKSQGEELATSIDPLDAVFGAASPGAFIAAYTHVAFRAGEAPLLTLKSAYFGSKADEFRQSVERIGESAFENHCHSWAESCYGALTSEEPIRIEDYREENAVFLEERYRLYELVQRRKDGPHIPVFPHLLAECFPKPGRLEGDALEVEGPLRVREVVCLELQEGSSWSLAPLQQQWDQSALYADMRCRSAGRELLMDYRVEMRQAVVPAEEASSFDSLVDELNATFAQTIALPETGSAEKMAATDTPAHFFFFGAVSLGCVAFIALLLAWMRRGIHPKVADSAPETGP